MKTVTEMAIEAGVGNCDTDFGFSTGRFATLVKAAHTADLLAGVEMPEPDLPPGQSPVDWDCGYYTADQLRETVAIAVLRERKLHCACIYADGVNTEQCKLHAAWCDTLHEQGDYRRERDALKSENEKLRGALTSAIGAKQLADFVAKHGEPGTRISQYGSAGLQNMILHKLTEPQPAAPSTSKALAECLSVLRPMAKGKFPQEQALEELAGYAAPSTSPLTEEQIEAIYEGLKGKGWAKDFARAIEAAHKIGAKP